MARKTDEYSVEDLAVERLTSFLKEQSQKGLTQQQVAAEAAIPYQYLSDIKGRRRPMTELVARRLGERFRIHYGWFTGASDSREQVLDRSEPPRTWLPLFTDPIRGDPRAHPKWDGIGIEVGSAASAKIILADLPYVLKYQRNDIKERVQRGDLILMSQAPAEKAEISVVEYRNRHYLARRTESGWQRLANGDVLSGDLEVRGHAVAVIWSSLVNDAIR